MKEFGKKMGRLYKYINWLNKKPKLKSLITVLNVWILKSYKILYLKINLKV